MIQKDMRNNLLKCCLTLKMMRNTLYRNHFSYNKILITRQLSKFMRI